MKETLAIQLAPRVMVEGYLLYPRRPSTRNPRRWPIGVLYPRACSLAPAGAEAWTMQTQCLIRGDRQTRVEARLRFLHIQCRTVGRLTAPLAELPPDADLCYEPLEIFRIDDKQFQTWQEAVEEEITLDAGTLGETLDRPREGEFSVPPFHDAEGLLSASGEFAGIYVRERQPLLGQIMVSTHAVGDGLFRLTFQIRNGTPFESAQSLTREAALPHSFVASHLLLRVMDGEFISMLDPPENCLCAVADCRQGGLWPFLIGAQGEKDKMLCAPMILDDYPIFLSESSGHVFDDAETHEVLAQRLIALAGQEKARNADGDKAADEQLLSLFGAIRDLESWEREMIENSKRRTVRVGDVELRAGDHVRLRPRSRTDALDSALDGRTATIVSIEQDYEDRIHLAVTIDTEPIQDVGQNGKLAQCFLFDIEEIEPLVEAG